MPKGITNSTLINVVGGWLESFLKFLWKHRRILIKIILLIAQMFARDRND